MVSITQKARDQRVSKHEAGYVDIAQSGESCVDCSMYGIGSCDYVEGGISPKGWCWYFEPINDRNRKHHR